MILYLRNTFDSFQFKKKLFSIHGIFKIFIFMDCLSDIDKDTL